MAATNKQELQKNEPPQANMSERFMGMVLSEFNGNVSGGLQISEYQRRLAQGYFIGIDRALQIAEENRIRKNKNNSNHDYDENIPVTWANVNLKDLALDVVHYARLGLDMMQRNHISAIPYKNNKTGQYDVTLMKGYAGIEYIARKYAIDPPLDIRFELLYEGDLFNPIKKDINHSIEAYSFDAGGKKGYDFFNRGELWGAFGYIEYSDSSKNKLIIMTVKDILKRKPQYAAAEFWGGKKKVWENGTKVEVETEGWFEEMCLKTIKREVWGEKHIAIDPKKVDDDYQYMKMREAQMAESEARAEIEANANKIYVDIDTDTGEINDMGGAAAPAADDLP